LGAGDFEVHVDSKLVIQIGYWMLIKKWPQATGFMLQAAWCELLTSYFHKLKTRLLLLPTAYFSQLVTIFAP
jgi:hypothetical protein